MKILNSGKKSAVENMTLDHTLLRHLDPDDQPILHFYDWDGPCATYGYFIRPYDYLLKEGIEKHHVQLARRPTGGGIIFHLTDFAFSLLIPSKHPAYSLNTLENYAWVNRQVMHAVEQFSKNTIKPSLSPCGGCGSFCMAQPTIYDIVVEGKKVGGAAQRKTKNGFLHQGTISLALPPTYILEEVLKPSVLEEMRRNSFFLLKDESEIEDAREAIRCLLLQIFTLEYNHVYGTQI